MIDLAPLVTAAVLATESKLWLYQGVKEHAVREGLGLSLTRYYQLVNQIVDTELALRIDPSTTRRLRQIRATRQRSRTLRSA